MNNGHFDNYQLPHVDEMGVPNEDEEDQRASDGEDLEETLLERDTMSCQALLHLHMHQYLLP